MCRWLAYSGEPILLEELLFKPKNSLIDQSMSARSAATPTNGDGFGVGWFGPRSRPGLFRSIRPAWNDFNLRDLCEQVEARILLAHVRAASLAPVQETNCHPFRHGNWLFMHNGEIFGIQKFRKRIIEAVDDAIFPDMLGTTDSEAMFFLALTFGLATDPEGALRRMAGFIERLGRDHGVDESLWMTLALSDGDGIHAVRYASDGEAPTLYMTRDPDDIFAINPALRARFAPDTRIIASEPAGDVRRHWQEVPQNSYVRIRGADAVVTPFVPEPH